LASLIGPSAFVKDAETDEAWYYDEHDLHCFSLCLPCQVVGEDMHDDRGVVILRDALIGYGSALRRVTWAIAEDLKEMTTSP
jgi:hypothetical protein